MPSRIDLSELGKRARALFVQKKSSTDGTPPPSVLPHFYYKSKEDHSPLFLHFRPLLYLALGVFFLFIFSTLFTQGKALVDDMIQKEHQMKSDMKELLVKIPTLKVQELQEENARFLKSIHEVREQLRSPRTYFAGSQSPLEYISSSLDIVETLLHILDKTLQQDAVVIHLIRDIKELPFSEVQSRYRNVAQYIEVQWIAWKKAVADDVAHLRILLKKNVEIPPELISESSRMPWEIGRSFLSLYDWFDSSLPVLEQMVGSVEPKTYMVLLQNSNEVRATGGFIGSVLYVTLSEGWVRNFEWKDSYVIDKKITLDLPPPPGLEYVNNRFTFRDANYWPDFPTSAQQLLWFADRAGEQQVDGVIAIHDRVVADLLQYTGEVEIPGYPVTVNKENFTDVLSLLVESKRNITDPKSLLFAFGNEFFKQITTLKPSQLPDIFIALHQSRPLLYMRDQNAQRLLKELDMTGEVFDDHGSSFVDDVLLVSTNVGGNKSDKYITQEVVHSTDRDSDGNLFGTLIVKRQHQWTKEIEAKVRALAQDVLGFEPNEPLVRIMGKGDHRDALRIYLPLGSEVTTISGIADGTVFTTYREFGHTVVQFLLVTPSQGTAQATITYKLIQRQQTPYTFRFTLAPGSRPISFSKIFSPRFGEFRQVIVEDHMGVRPFGKGGSLEDRVVVDETYSLYLE